MLFPAEVEAIQRSQSLLAARPAASGQISVAQAQTQTQLPLLAVLQVDDAAAWRTIVDRLDATGLAYYPVNWDEIEQADLGEASVLFLPNVETISAEQLLGLQSWINRGGRLIVSGATGSQSSAGVQNALRSLLGAYWSADLTQPQPLLPLQIASHRWVRMADAGSTTAGGILVPTSLGSQPVAVWNQLEPTDSGSSNAAAVVVTQKTTFLGWRWGDANSSPAEFDQSWLQAALSRFEGMSPLLAAPVARAQPPLTGRAPTPSRPVAPSPSPQIAPAPEPAPEAVPAPEARPAPVELAPGPTAELQPSQDPAEQMAPPALDVERNAVRITLYEATSMRQELENLIGRYESALILANARSGVDLRATHGPGAAAQDKADLTHAAGEVRPVRAEASAQPAIDQPSLDDDILAAARSGYSAFTDAMQQGDYGRARQQWLSTRQLLWDNFPLDRPLSQPEVRAMWLDRGTIVQAGSRRGLEQLFDRLAAAGINTVFFETVNAGYPIFPSQVAPAQNPLTRGWDPLAEAVDLAHARGMELHAWVWTFATGNQAHNRILNQSASYPGPVLTAHPDWANYDNRGSMIPPGQQKPFLDPANPEVRRYLLSLYEEIVTRYPVDGLQLDYIRYPFQDPRPGGHTYGYGRAARQQFLAQTGVDPVTLSPANPDQRQLWQAWTEFRIEQVSSFVAETSELLHRINPDLILSTAVFALPTNRRLTMIQQDWETWAQQGSVDMIVLMSYAGDTNSLQRLTNPWLNDNSNLGAALILPGIRLLNLSDQIVLDQIQALRDSPSGGFALFAAENLDSNLQTIFQRTQGASDETSQPIPYRDPFGAAASRYALLIEQWNWLLDQNQLQIRQTQLDAWRSKTTTLEQALQTLAADPSTANLQQANALLQSFQSQFKSWMDLPTLSETYRIRTWQNQLDAIAKLLHYGEQTIIVERAEAAQAQP